MMKKLLALVLALASALTLVACGSGGNGSSGGDGTSLTIAQNADYQTLHPANWTTNIEHRIDSQIYDTLVRHNFEDENKLDGVIAESWELSDDNCCYTFHLRKGITFHNGTPLTAKDVAFSLDLYTASEAQSGNVAGYDHSEIVDDNTIKVYTSSPFAPFLNNLTLVFIGSKDYYDSVGEDTFAQQPIGSGAYKFVSHSEGDKVVLQAYEDYFMGAAAIKDVTFKVVSDMSAMSIGLQSGGIDFAEIRASIRDTLENAQGITVTTAKQTNFAFVAMNTEKEPFSNVKFRQAVNYALDRQSLIATVMDGAAEENSNLLNKDRFGYSDSQKQYTYDPDQAKALLAECGYADGYDMGTLVVPDQYKLLAQAIQEQLKAVGLTCQLEVLEFNSYLNKLRQGDYTVTCLQMSLEGDTQNMAMAVCKDYIGMANNARWYNDQVEQWFNDALAAVDDNERAAIYDKIFSLVQDQAVYAVLYNPVMLYAYSDKLTIHQLPLEGLYYVYYFHW